MLKLRNCVSTNYYMYISVFSYIIYAIYAKFMQFMQNVCNDDQLNALLTMS